MSEKNALDEKCLERARELVKVLEEGDTEKVETVLGELTHIHETTIFQELGQLTRELHNSLTGFGVDSKLTSITEHDIPDAKERLSHVIKVTDEAAHKTMNAIDECVPICENFEKLSEDIGSKWQRFISREISAEEFRSLSKEIGDFLEASPQEASKLKDHLNNVLMAQDFQDLTGQTIRCVIKMVQEIEDSLVEFFKLSTRRGGAADSDEEKAQVKKERKETKLEGPQIPGMESSDAVSGQDEVDDLLSSLGF